MTIQHVYRFKTILRSMVVIAVLATTAASAQTATYTVGTITNVSGTCSGQNAESEQAVDSTHGNYVYEVWMGCSGIAFARSTNGGNTFSAPITLPGTVGSTGNVWDPSIAVAPDGTVYAAFIRNKGGQYYPIVVASFDHGVTFPQVTSVIPPDPKNWGDRDFLAVGPDGSLYLTWDYGPERTSVTYLCPSNGSCTFLSGDLNVVSQKSSDRGKTFASMVDMSPGYPASGADSAPLLVDSSGQIFAFYQDFPITNTKTYALNPGSSFSISSVDGAQTWESNSLEVVGAQAGTMAPTEWWIDGDIAMDGGGNLFATWDTQGTNSNGSANDIGWLSYSTNFGTTWSAPIQATPDTLNVPHIIEVAGGPSGIAYVAWLSNSNPKGYALYLRAFSITSGTWISPTVQVSTAFGASSVWPGDNFGISTLSPYNLVLSWGSATNGKQSQIFAVPVTVQIN